jgi:hypothetical protein
VPRNDTSDQVLLGKIRVKIQSETQVCKKEAAAEQGGAEQGSAEQGIAKIMQSKKGRVNQGTTKKG